jgi:hypothetical protein
VNTSVFLVHALVSVCVCDRARSCSVLSHQVIIKAVCLPWARRRHCAIMSRAMRVAVRPYGVLGTQLTSMGIKKVAAAPAPGLPIVDPAGMEFIRNGPKGAGGAAGQIYRWLGIAEDDKFPAPVRDAIRAPLRAKLHFYGMNACLHVAGPNFKGRDCSREQALGELTEAYDAVLREFAKSRLGGLRLLPISGGIFAGSFGPELPTLTCSALRTAFDALPNNLQHIVSVARLDMCIFMESEYDAYAQAFEVETARAAQFADSLEMGSTPRPGFED